MCPIVLSNLSIEPNQVRGFNVIFIAAGDGYTITNNYLGVLLRTAVAHPGHSEREWHPTRILFMVFGLAGGLTMNPSTVQGNTIANISLFVTEFCSAIEFVVYFPQQVSKRECVGFQLEQDRLQFPSGTIYTSFYGGIYFYGLYGNFTNNSFGILYHRWTSGST